MFKILTFYLGEEKYGIKIEHIVTVEKNQRFITNIPNGSNVVRGVVNVRSKIIPIIDLKKLYTSNFTDNINDKKLIIFEKEQYTGAIIVDNTDDILDVKEEQMEKIERDGESINIINLENEAFVIIDVDEIIENCKC